MDIEICLRMKVLDLVNSLLYLPIFEDGYGVASRVQDHGWHDVGKASKSRRKFLDRGMKLEKRQFEQVGKRVWT